MPKLNDYTMRLRDFDRTPKAVYAAVAFSFAMRLYSDNPVDAEAALIDEWRILHANGIVPQEGPPVSRWAEGGNMETLQVECYGPAVLEDDPNGHLPRGGYMKKKADDLIFARCGRYERLASLLAAALRRLLAISPTNSQEAGAALAALARWDARS